MSLTNEQTPIRVAVLLQLLLDHCLTRKAHERNAMVTEPTVDNRLICRPATDLTATDLLHVLGYEFTQAGQFKITASAVCDQHTYSVVKETCVSAAHYCTLMHTRAAYVQYYKLHVMEEKYDWRTVAGDQIEDHCRRVIGVLNPSDRNPFHPVLFNLRSAIREDLNRQALTEGQLLLDNMASRGITAHTIYGNFLNQIPQLSNLYSPPLVMHLRSRNLSRPQTRSPRQRF